MKKSLVIIMLLISYSTYSQSEISGTVTYFFNKYQGDKPDIGAKVYLIDSLSFIKLESSKKLSNYNLVDNLRALVYYYSKDIDRIKADKDYISLISSKEKLEKKDKHLHKKNKDKYSKILNNLKPFEKKIEDKQKDISNYTKQLQEHQADNETNWKEYCKSTLTSLLLIEKNLEGNIRSTTVDGTGKYLLKGISEGPYFLLLVSNNRTGLNMATIQGNFKIQKIDVKGEFMDKSHNFSL